VKSFDLVLNWPKTGSVAKVLFPVCSALGSMAWDDGNDTRSTAWNILLSHCCRFYARHRRSGTMASMNWNSGFICQVERGKLGRTSLGETILSNEQIADDEFLLQLSLHSHRPCRSNAI
jgi:hypothetical protein